MNRERILYQENSLRFCNDGIANFPLYLNTILYPNKPPIKAIAPNTNANTGAVNSFFTSSTVRSTISSDSLSTSPSCAASVISENDIISEGKAITNSIAVIGITISFLPIYSPTEIFIIHSIKIFSPIFLSWGQPDKIELTYLLTTDFLLEAPSFLHV